MKEIRIIVEDDGILPLLTAIIPLSQQFHVIDRPDRSDPLPRLEAPPPRALASALHDRTKTSTKPNKTKTPNAQRIAAERRRTLIQLLVDGYGEPMPARRLGITAKEHGDKVKDWTNSAQRLIQQGIIERVYISGVSHLQIPTPKAQELPRDTDTAPPVPTVHSQQ